MHITRMAFFKNMELLQLIDDSYGFIQCQLLVQTETSRSPCQPWGLGIRKATDMAASAFISSRNATAHLTEQMLPQTLPAPSFDDSAEAVSFRRNYSRVFEEPIPSQRSNQKAWGFKSAKASLNRMDEEDQMSKARLIPSMGTHLDDDTLRIAVAQRVSAPLRLPHKCKRGDHGYP